MHEKLRMIAVLTWVLGLIAALVGARIVYVGARILLMFIAPGLDSRIDQFFISRDVRRILGFMFERGYTMSDVKYVPHHYGGWHFQLDSEPHHLSIIFDEEESVTMKFRSVHNAGPFEIPLDALIYFVTRGQRYIVAPFRTKSLSRASTLHEIAPLLSEYLPQIENLAITRTRASLEELPKYQDEFFARRSRAFSEWFAAGREPNL